MEQGRRVLNAIVEPDLPHQIAVLSRQNRPGAEPVRGCRNRSAQRLKWFRHRAAYLCFGDERIIVRRNVNSLDPTMRFDLANERLVQRAPPEEAQTGEA